MSSSDLGERCSALTALRAFEANPEDVAAIDAAAIQALLGAAVRLYAARVERTGRFAGVEPGAIAATDALVAASALLKSVNVAPFELGLWDAWS